MSQQSSSKEKSSIKKPQKNIALLNETIERAFIRDEYKKIPSLVEQKAEINNIRLNPPDGKAPMPLIHIAMSEGFTNDLVRTLLNIKSLDINIRYESHTPLIYAVNARSIDKVKLLIDHSCDLNAVTSRKCNALHYAVAIGSVEIVEALCKAGIDGNQISTDGFTPLGMALVDCKWKMVEELIKPEYKYDINLQSKEVSPLFSLLSRGEYGLASKIIHDPRIKLTVTHQGYNEIDFAVSRGLIPIIREFKKAGLFKVNAKTLDQHYLIIAAKTERWELVEELLNLEYETDVSVTFTPKKFSIITILIANKKFNLLEKVILNPNMKKFSEEALKSFRSLFMQLELIEALTTLKAVGLFDCNAQSFGGLPLLEAAFNYSKPVIKFLLSDPKIDINAQNEKGQAAIHTAASSDSENLQLLLEYKSTQVNIVDKEDWNALHYAAHNNRVNNIRLLLQTDPSLFTKKDIYGGTPLRAALQDANLEALEYFHKYYPQAFLEVDTEKLNVLHIAVIRKEPKVIKFLIAHYPQLLGSLDDDHRSPLIYALNMDCGEDILEPLIKHSKTHPSSAKYFEAIPLLHIAASADAAQSVKYLLTLSDINIDKLNFGDSAFHVAAITKSYDAAEALLEGGANPYLLPAKASTIKDVANTLLFLHQENSSTNHATYSRASSVNPICLPEGCGLETIFKKVKSEAKTLQITPAQDNVTLDSNSSSNPTHPTKQRKNKTEILSWSQFVASLPRRGIERVSNQDNFIISLKETMIRRNSKCEIKNPLGQPSFFSKPESETQLDSNEMAEMQKENYFYFKNQPSGKPLFLKISTSLMAEINTQSLNSIIKKLKEGGSAKNLEHLVDRKVFEFRFPKKDYRILASDEFISETRKLSNGKTLEFDTLVFTKFVAKHVDISKKSEKVESPAPSGSSL